MLVVDVSEKKKLSLYVTVKIMIIKLFNAFCCLCGIYVLRSFCFGFLPQIESTVIKLRNIFVGNVMFGFGVFDLMLWHNITFGFCFWEENLIL